MDLQEEMRKGVDIKNSELKEGAVLYYLAS